MNCGSNSLSIILQALEEALAPRLRLAGDTGSLTKFGDFFKDRSLEKGTAIVLLYRVEGVLELALLQAGASDFSQVTHIDHILRFTTRPVLTRSAKVGSCARQGKQTGIFIKLTIQ